MSRRSDVSMRNSDYASRRHDGSLRAELRKLYIDDSGPRRVEGSPGHVGERSHRGSTASTTASAVPPRLSATLVASTESSRRRAVPPPPSSAGEAPRRRDSQKQLASTLGLPSIMPNSGTSSHHRGDSSSSIRRRSADEQRGDSAYGSRGGREERGSSERVRDRREVSDRERERSVQCVSPEIALGQHRAALTALERSEILEYPRVYFAGIGAKKVRSKEASGGG